MLNKLFDLSGRVALVTGGSKGIGKAVAHGLAEAGANVAISARHEDELKAAVKEIGEGLKSKVAYRVADMTDREQVVGLAKWAEQEFGKCDILFNNAGSNDPMPLVEQDLDKWDRIIELNLTSCMLLSRELAKGMVARKWGRIIYTSSIMAFSSFSGRGAYSATKAALVGMARTQALELGASGVTVNCLAPGPIMTDLPMSLLSDAKKKEFGDRTAVKRWGQPIDMVGPVLMFASEAGAFVSGVTLVADGGLLCRTFND